jgi:hypothetical protein
MAHRHLNLGPDTLGKRYQSLLLVAWQRVSHPAAHLVGNGFGDSAKACSTQQCRKQAMAKSHRGWFHR